MPRGRVKILREDEETPVLEGVADAGGVFQGALTVEEDHRLWRNGRYADLHFTGHNPQVGVLVLGNGSAQGASADFTPACMSLPRMRSSAQPLAMPPRSTATAGSAESQV